MLRVLSIRETWDKQAVPSHSVCLLRAIAAKTDVMTGASVLLQPLSVCRCQRNREIDLSSG